MTIYVSTSGNDSNPGTIGSPKRAIAAAINTASSAGDSHVIVESGTYREGSTYGLDVPSISLDITVTSDTDDYDDVTISPGTDNASTALRCAQNMSHKLTLRGITLAPHGDADAFNFGTVFLHQNAGKIRFENCHIAHTGVNDEAVEARTSWSGVDAVAEFIDTKITGGKSGNPLVNFFGSSSATRRVVFEDCEVIHGGDSAAIQCANVGDVTASGGDNETIIRRGIWKTTSGSYAIHIGPVDAAQPTFNTFDYLIEDVKISVNEVAGAHGLLVGGGVSNYVLRRVAVGNAPSGADTCYGIVDKGQNGLHEDCVYMVSNAGSFGCVLLKGAKNVRYERCLMTVQTGGVIRTAPGSRLGGAGLNQDETEEITFSDCTLIAANDVATSQLFLEMSDADTHNISFENCRLMGNADGLGAAPQTVWPLSGENANTWSRTAAVEGATGGIEDPPALPAEAAVLANVEYGYASDPRTGSLAVGGVTGFSAAALSEILTAMGLTEGSLDSKLGSVGSTTSKVLVAVDSIAKSTNLSDTPLATLTANGGVDQAAWQMDTSVSEGASGIGRTFWQVGNSQRVRRVGKLVQVQLQTAAVHDFGVPAKIKVFRSGSVVSESEWFDLSDSAGVRQVIDLVTPIGVQVGDYLGIYVSDAGAGDASGLALTNAAGESVKYVDGDVNSDAVSATLTNYSINLAAMSIAPRLAITGDSIAEGHNGASDYHGFLHTSSTPGGNEASEIGHAIRKIKGDAFGYENHALGSQTFAWVRSTGVPSAVASRAPNILIHCGVNDIAQSREWSDVEADLDAIRAAVPASTALYINEILPWTAGSDTQAATIRDWNTRLAVWCDENNVLLIRCHDAMGQVRGTTGEIDDLATQYNQDGVHLTEAGVNKIAEIVSFVLAGSDIESLGQKIDEVANRTSKSAIRQSIGGRWTDEDGKTFDLEITDTP
ncbi:SGNH/GDSL hydrolase family protein [Roseiconus lacunae]|uniref:SGNH/GDSL hydrolase family protein n=1 Tax=Roseiconus lacunae TaxID=2605694 RepID=UPI0011F33CF0|nr:SGNH/GDSL hydrolase family protein [Roseiconus lacunae]